MSYFQTDELLATIVPILVYWLYSGMYMLLDLSSSARRYHLHSDKEVDTGNLVPKDVVLKGVLLQQALQATVSFLVFWMANGGGETAGCSRRNQQPRIAVQAVQFLIAMAVFDTWQYFTHRYMHRNKFMYKHFHSWHHRLVVPYAFGAQYNHPAEGVLIETMAGAAAYLVSGMSPRTSIFFFSLATVKGIDDHCGMLFPWNPFHRVFENNAAYHDIHHQHHGAKYNFSQPFFVLWDKLLGTYKPYLHEN